MTSADNLKFEDILAANEAGYTGVVSLSGASALAAGAVAFGIAALSI